MCIMKQLGRKEAVFWLLLAFNYLSLYFHTTRAQQGFTSIDCGATKSYTDTNGLLWTPDEDLETINHVGNAFAVTPPAIINPPTQFSSIRYFPGNQTKYCYVFNNEDHKVVQGNAYLVRASFWAGATLPYETQVKGSVEFKLLIYADEWDTVHIVLPQLDHAYMKEMYVVAVKDTIDVCLAGKGIGMDIPFISSLVLRPLSSNMSSVTLMNQDINKPLFYMYRVNYGASSNDTIIGYRSNGVGDPYDRVWQPETREPTITTLHDVNTNVQDHPPKVVMQDAYESDESFNLTFSLPSRHSYYFVIYFSEISLSVTMAGQRVFKLQIFSGTNVDPSFESMWDVFKDSGNRQFITYIYYATMPFILGDGNFMNFAFTKENGSIYGPIVCGLEILQVSDHDMPLGTDDNEVQTLKNVTSPFSTLKSWSGDPCLPNPYNWLKCTNYMRPSIYTISLSNKSLGGKLPTALNNFKDLVELSLAENDFFGSIPDLSSLQNLKVLDLHNNSLSGEIPESLGYLSSLTTLNLDYNNLSGQIPASLLDKASRSQLKFSIAGNPFICNDLNNEDYCKESLNASGSSNNNHKGNNVVIAWVGSGIAIVVLVAIGVFVFCIVKHKKKLDVVKNDPSYNQAFPHGIVLGSRSNQAIQFSFQSIKTITRNFEKILGEGGFGPVYHGVLENRMNVAVKVLAQNSRQGEQQFLNEVELLSRVHHKNLVSLLGYCIESQLVLVYEYMENGSLSDSLNGNGANLVAWRDRVHIALDAAEGLDYLHRGCNPSIIHRDVKSSNILLNKEFKGKIGDFGISKSNKYTKSMAQGGSQIFTVVQGSFGYLDPEYAETSIATHSIDVYAFGIVLFELITGKPPLFGDFTRIGNQQHILQWVKPHVEQGDISRFVDPTLDNDFNVSSMWKVVDLAMMCVEHDRRTRPEMSEVTKELNSALSIELQNNQYNTSSSEERPCFTYTTELRPR